MADNDKFSKTLDDENLDEVAGGTIKEFQKDFKFFQDLGLADKNVILNFKFEENIMDVQNLWRSVGIIQGNKGSNPENENNYMTNVNDKATRISRQDAMIYAMRNKNKYLNLEDYI